jgi:putative ABC transport system permease protein
VSLTETALQNFRKIMAENVNIQIFWNVAFAGIIAFGVVYNAARISLAERSRELASLRVLGFTRGEISLILLGELAVLTVLSLPVGELMAFGLCSKPRVPGCCRAPARGRRAAPSPCARRSRVSC